MAKKNKSAELAKYFGEFIDSRENVRRPGTTSNYREAMILFIRFLEDQMHVTEQSLCIEQFNRENLTAWRDWMFHENGNKAATCNLRVSQIRAFLKWLKQRHPEYRALYTATQEVEALQSQEGDGIIDPISEKAMALLLAEPGTKTLTGLKYTAIMGFQYGTGTRIDEVLSTRLGDINLDCAKPSAVVTGKGRKTRVVNIPAKTAKILRKYIKTFHGDAVDQDAFLFYSDIKGKYSKMTSAAYQKQIGVYARRANAKDPTCPAHVRTHQLRHSFATHSLDHGVSVYTISKNIGHKSVETTMKYLGITPNLKTEAMMKTESFVAKNTKVNWRKTRKLEDMFR